MSTIRYFRCTPTQPWEDKHISALQEKLFQDMEKQIGPPRGITGIEGLFIDFNAGLRLELPKGNFRVRISDYLGGRIFFDELLSHITLISKEKFLISWQIDIWQDDVQVFSHTFNLTGKKMLLHCSSMALGDTLAFLPYARACRDYFQAEVFIWVADYIKETVALLYPDLPQIPNPRDMYATYYLGTWIGGPYGAPVDGRSYPLPQIAAAIAGLPMSTPIPRVKINCHRSILEPYICIGVQASTPRKGWHYPQGWEIITAELKRAGYRVLCIDRHTLSREGNYETICPENAENLTGNFSLIERIKLLAHATCFIGLSSGLSWLAYNAGCPVVLISGFTESFNEFPTPYRVINRLVCHGCYNDVRVNFMTDGTICPYHEGTAREMECSRFITPAMVLEAVQRALDG